MTDTHDAKSERREFQSEARRVLDLMIHSVYSDPDIFLRELISNASDALDKLRVTSLTDPSIVPEGHEPKIVIAPDQAARTLTVSDNGIGMTRDELADFLGTVARSGTGEFAASTKNANELIGQFGVGFYSSFIAADRVEVTSRKAGSGEAWKWSSDGQGEYELSPADKDEIGTSVLLHLRDISTDDEEARRRDYSSEWTIRDLIRRYSDFVAHPIYILKDAKEDGPINSMKAIWTIPESEMTDSACDEFYRHLTRDWDDPATRIVYRGEGSSEFYALLFIPKRPPLDLFYRDSTKGVDLYIRRVFIMNGCRDLVPDYLRFLRGVVDSEDLPLNVSRELLQQDDKTLAIRRSVTRKTLDTLRRMKSDKPDEYKAFWETFGQVLKEGIVQDERNRSAIMKLCMFETTTASDTSLDEIVSRAPDSKKIYYITGAPIETLRSSPKLEAYRERGVEVLLLGHPVDEFWVNAAIEWNEREFANIASEDVDIEGAEPGKTADDDGVASRIKRALEGASGVAATVDEVAMSNRLVSSPAMFVTKGASLAPQTRAMLKAMGQPVPDEHRVLEINPEHPITKRIAADSGERDKEWAAVLIGLAQAADGDTIENGAEFAKITADLLAR